jgi:transcriptional antiterminator RfaH
MCTQVKFLYLNKINYMPWYALYTEPRHEKKVAERLEKLGVQVYCPLVTQIKQWSDRKKKVEVPILPSYVFVKLDETCRDVVFQVSGVVRYLYWLGKPATIRNSEIENLQQWLQNKEVTSFEVTGIEVGSAYTIESGPFSGREGKVTKVDKNQMEIILEELGFKVILKK